MKVSNLLLPRMPRATIAVIKNFHLKVLFVIQQQFHKYELKLKIWRSSSCGFRTFLVKYKLHRAERF